MHPATAAKKGIKEGDMIEVTSRSGKLVGKVKLSHLFHPEVIGTPGNFGRRSKMMNPIAREGINYNQLVSPDDGWFDPLNTALSASPRVKIRKV
jgi:thiosulfate reductase / polysulfide reductase chain A